MAKDQARYIPSPPQGGNYLTTRYLDEPVLSDMAHRRIAARAYKRELSMLGEGASTEDVAAARKRADAVVESIGVTGSETAQAREDVRSGTEGMGAMGRATTRAYAGVFEPGMRSIAKAQEFLGFDPSTTEQKHRLYKGLGQGLAEQSEYVIEDVAGIAGQVTGYMGDPAFALPYMGALKGLKALRGAPATWRGAVAQDVLAGIPADITAAGVRTGGDIGEMAKEAGYGTVGATALGLLGRGYRGLRGIEDPYARSAASRMTPADRNLETAKIISDKNRARYGVGDRDNQALQAKLESNRGIAELTEAADDAARRGDVAEANKLRERAARQVEQDEALGKMGVELYSVRKAAGEQAELLDRARDIDVDVPSTQVDKFQERAAKTAKLRGEAVPETPSVRPEVEADVAARQVDDQVREEALKDPDNFQAVQDFQADHGLSRQEAEDFVIHGTVPESWGGAPKQAAADVPVVKAGGAPAVRASEVDQETGLWAGREKQEWELTVAERKQKMQPGESAEYAEFEALRDKWSRSKFDPSYKKKFGKRDQARLAELHEKFSDFITEKNWRGMADDAADPLNASRVLETVADKAKSHKILSEVLDRAESMVSRGGLGDTGRVARAVKVNKSATPDIIKRAEALDASYRSALDADLAPTGASGQQLDMGLQSGPFNPEQLDRLILSGLEGGKWAGKHAIAGARWALNAGGDAIRSMRDFAQVMIDKFGRGIRKHVPEMWDRFKKMQSRQADLRRRTQARRSRGAIDLRSPRKDPTARVTKTARQKIESSQRAEMRREFSQRDAERVALQDDAVKKVEERLGRETASGAYLARRASKVKSKEGYDKVMSELDRLVHESSEKTSIASTQKAISKSLSMDKSSGVPGHAALRDDAMSDYANHIRAFGIEDPARPTKQELARMTPQERQDLVESYTHMKDAYTHSRKYGKRPYAEGANPLEGDRNFATESWGRSIRRIVSAGGSALDAAIDPVSDTLRRMSPRLHGRLQSYVVRHHRMKHAFRERIDPLMEVVNKNLKKFPKDAKIRLTSALSRGDEAEVLRIADAMGEHGEPLRELWAESRKVLGELYKKAREAGIDVGFLENYWPRMVKSGRADDLTSFFTGKPTDDITRALKTHARNKGISVDGIDDATRRGIVEDVTRGRGQRTADGGRPSNLKNRQIGDIPDEAMQFYEPYDAAMDAYIDRVTEAIARKELFGKSTPLSGKGDEFFEFGKDSRIESIDDLNASLGTILDEDGVAPKNTKQALEVIRTLFNSTSVSTSGFTSNMRGFGYLATMGQVKSAITQVEDLASTVVFMPHEIPNIAKALYQSVIGKADANMLRFGFDRIGEEFAGKRGMEKAVDLLFKTTGLSYIDRVLKNTTLQAAYLGGQRAAKNVGSKAYNRVRKEAAEKWGEESADRLMKDLAEGNLDSDILSTYVVEKLSGIQPLTGLDVPLGYHYAKQSWQGSQLAGAPVLAYQLKTFTLRRMGALRREGITGMARGISMIKNGEKAEGTKLLLRSTRNLTAMAAVLTAAGATRQQAVGYLYGNEDALSYDVSDTLLSLTGLNRYSAQQLQRGGADFYSSVFAPPSVTTALDVVTDGFRMADGKMPRTAKRVPHIQTLDIFSRGGFSDYMRGGSKPPEEETED